jgi:hypothetical protein
MLNYRAFEATIVLKSYRNRLIDMFDAPTLYDALYSEAAARDMLPCGEGLCFKRGIRVRGCHCKLIVLSPCGVGNIHHTDTFLPNRSHLFLDPSQHRNNQDAACHFVSYARSKYG